MLYQKGEKLKELQQTLNDIPTISHLDISLFAMSEEDLKNFKSKIEDVFNDLSNALFNTLLGGTDDECNKRIEIACNNVIEVLKNNYTKDLVQSFYKEKQLYYDFMFSDLIDDLRSHYPEYSGILLDIKRAYSDLLENKKIFDFPNITSLLIDHFYISNDLRYNVINDQTKSYLIHCLELIYEEISKNLKEECSREYLNPDVLPNTLRKLIYYIEDDLNIGKKAS